MDLQRRADREHQARVGGQRRRAVDGVLREELAEQDDVGLQRRAAVAQRHAVGLLAEPAARLLQRVGPPALQARGGADRAVDLDRIGPRAGVQAVDVLRDHARDQPAPLELDDGAVGAVGLLAVEDREALPVEGPEARRVAPPHVDVRDLHRVDVRPDARLRGAEVRDAGRDGDARRR